MLACSASATAPDLATLDTEGVLYRTAISDAVTVSFIADQLTARRDAAALPEGETYDVSIVARSDDYGIQVGNGLATAWRPAGIEAAVVGYNPRRVTFREEAASIAAAAPDAVVMVSYEESAHLIGDLLAAGVAAATLIGLDDSFDPRLAERSVPSDPAAANGLQVIGSTGSRAFVDRLIAVPGTTQLVYGAQMYDCAVATALAAHAAASADPAEYGPRLSR